MRGEMGNCMVEGVGRGVENVDVSREEEGERGMTRVQYNAYASL